MTKARRALAASALLLGSLAPVVGGRAPESRPLASNREITPVELASWIKDRKPGLRVIDIRPDQDFDVFHLPNALNFPSATRLPADLDSESTVVLYGEGEAPSRDLSSAWNRESGLKPYILRHGLDGWLDEVMNPVLLDGASPEDKAAFERAAGLSRYFGGLPRVLSTAESLDFKRRKPSAMETKRRGC